MTLRLAWTWESANVKERGDWVRASYAHVGSDITSLCQLFGLTTIGATRILHGADWRDTFVDGEGMRDAPK